MSGRIRLHDAQERDVVEVWRHGHLSPNTIELYLRWVRHFRSHCQKHGLSETDELTLAGAVRFAQSYIGSRKKGPIGGSSRSTARNALHAWACALCALGISMPKWLQPREAVALEPLLEDYVCHRRTQCGIAEGTLLRDIETARRFLQLLRQRGKSAGKLTLADVDAFVGDLAGQHSNTTVADRCSSLRSFLRFLRMTGRIRRDLAACVMAPRTHVAARPPRAMAWSHVKRILQAIPKSTPPGRRDFAMLLLMATYGLGAAEVLGLRIEDIDFQSAILRARRPKTGVRIELPLLSPIAKALSAYLQAERPRPVSSRRVFLRSNMPYEPLTSGAIRHRIRLYAGRAGISAPTIGCHAFRHSHASRQIDSGANLKVVSDILGHRSPSSTSVYVRVALRRLRMVALPVPR